jgi:hypothetical protein
MSAVKVSVCIVVFLPECHAVPPGGIDGGCRAVEAAKRRLNRSPLGRIRPPVQRPAEKLAVASLRRAADGQFGVHIRAGADLFLGEIDADAGLLPVHRVEGVRRNQDQSARQPLPGVDNQIPDTPAAVVEEQIFEFAHFAVFGVNCKTFDRFGCKQHVSSPQCGAL